MKMLINICVGQSPLTFQLAKQANSKSTSRVIWRVKIKKSNVSRSLSMLLKALLTACVKRHICLKSALKHIYLLFRTTVQHPCVSVLTSVLRLNQSCYTAGFLDADWLQERLAVFLLEKATHVAVDLRYL